MSLRSRAWLWRLAAVRPRSVSLRVVCEEGDNPTIPKDFLKKPFASWQYRVLVSRYSSPIPMHLLLSWLILSVSFWLTAMMLPGFHVRSFGSAIFVAAVFGIINALLGWLFFGVLTIATLGIAYLLSFITRWFINAVFLSLTAKLTSGLKIDGFRWALVGSLVISLVSSGIDWVLRSAFA
jgi:putative membrane protein